MGSISARTRTPPSIAATYRARSPSRPVPAVEKNGSAWTHRPPSVLSAAIADATRSYHPRTVAVDSPMPRIFAYMETGTSKRTL